MKKVIETFKFILSEVGRTEMLMMGYRVEK